MGKRILERGDLLQCRPSQMSHAVSWSRHVESTPSIPFRTPCDVWRLWPSHPPPRIKRVADDVSDGRSQDLGKRRTFPDSQQTKVISRVSIQQQQQEAIEPPSVRLSLYEADLADDVPVTSLPNSFHLAKTTTKVGLHLPAGDCPFHKAVVQFKV